ncbi:MAG: NfeD family protein [Roseinatronobacter sp.]
MDLFALPDWTIWGMIAVALLIAEMVTTVYVALGFAISAAVVGLIVWLVPGLHVFVQGLIWAALGLAVWLGLSRWNRARHAGRRDINDFDSRDALPPSERARRDPRPQGESE